MTEDFLLLFRNRLYRATFRTGAATHTYFGIDNVLSFALADRSARTGIRTCTARDAGVADFICHPSVPPFDFFLYFITNIFVCKRLIQNFLHIFADIFIAVDVVGVVALSARLFAGLGFFEFQTRNGKILINLAAVALSDFDF